MTEFNLLDTVRYKSSAVAVPKHLMNVFGAIVEVLEKPEIAFLVEFFDEDGKSIDIFTVLEADLELVEKHQSIT